MLWSTGIDGGKLSFVVGFSSEVVACGRKEVFFPRTFCVAKIGEKMKSESVEENLLLNENENSVIKINTTARFARGLNYRLWQLSKLGACVAKSRIKSYSLATFPTNLI